MYQSVVPSVGVTKSEARLPGLPVYLINLDRSPDRLSFMQEQADRIGFDVIRIAAIDGTAKLPIWMRDQFMRDAKIASPMTPGEVGCYASHLFAYRNILDDGQEAAVILEDDSLLADDFPQAAAAAIRAARGGWDIIHLTSTRECVPVASLGNGRSLVRYSRLPMRAAAYVISRQGAKKLLRSCERRRPIDMEFRYAWVAGLDILGVAPPPVTPLDTFTSTIDPTTNDRKRCRNYWAPSLSSRVFGKITTKLKLGLIGTLATWSQHSFQKHAAPAFRRSELST